MSSSPKFHLATYELPLELTQTLLSPSLVVYLPQVRNNIRKIIKLTRGNPNLWRPHVKTTKIPQVWAELVKAGIRQYKCATTREAELMLSVLDKSGVEGDVLVAMPLAGPSLTRLDELSKKYPKQKLGVLCEDPLLESNIPRSLTVFVDINSGMNRTGVPITETKAIVEIALKASHSKRFGGVHWYEGHIHDMNLTTRTKQAHNGYDGLMSLVRAIQAKGVHVPEIITSGTPGFLSALSYEPFTKLKSGTLHRVSPGTVVYYDGRTFVENPNLAEELEPAALVFSRVLSHPKTGLVTLDCGSKGVASEVRDPVAVVLGHPQLVAQGPSEEHLPFAFTPNSNYTPPARGSNLFLFPYHICPTVNLAESAVLVDTLDDKLKWEIVPVAARAHEISIQSKL